MISRTRLLAAGLATAGLVTLQVGTSAQGTTSATSPTQTYGQSSTEKKSPRYHLDQAKRVLDEIERSVGSETSSATSGTTSGTTGGTATGTTGGTTTGGTMTGQSTMSGQSGDLATTVKELRRHFNQLESAYEKSSGGAGTGTSGTSGTTGSGTTGSGTTGTGTTGQAATSGESWMTHYSRLNQVLDRLNVPKTSTSTGMGSGSTSGTTGSGSTSGTTGTGTTGSGTTTGSTQSGSTSSQSIDPTMMSKLREFRMHIDNFHAAAMAEGR